MNSNCPYCRAPVRIEPDDQSDFENEFREAQCGSCAKFFTYSTEISISYYPQKADCLNDDEHIFHKTTRPSGGFLKLTCKTCGEERSVSIQTLKGDS